MPKQVTEKYFVESLKESNPDVFVEKIQVNPFAFTSTSADYLVQTKERDLLVECKQITMKNTSVTEYPRVRGSFDISRVTQESKLQAWDSRLKRNASFLFIVF